MTDAEDLRANLLASRNTDGGWPSQRGRSWTEPTALALLALQGTDVPSETRAISASWLAHRQSSDGGWPPCAEVAISTWVTSLALLALAQEDQHSAGCTIGLAWLRSHVYPKLNAVHGFLQDHLGVSPNHAPGSSPWFPGTAGWVIPTAFSILALSRWSGRTTHGDFQDEIRRAQDYLLTRRCFDSGWNHGGSPQRSETAPSYPETTGLALLALASRHSPSLGPSVRLAEHFLQTLDSTEGFSWLVIGLTAHGIELKDVPPFAIRPKTTQEIALRLMALQTLECRNPFLKIAS